MVPGSKMTLMAGTEVSVIMKRFRRRTYGYLVLPGTTKIKNDRITGKRIKYWLITGVQDTKNLPRVNL